MGGAACAVSSSAIRPQSACRQAAAAYAASLCGFMGVPPIPKCSTSLPQVNLRILLDYFADGGTGKEKS